MIRSNIMSTNILRMNSMAIRVTNKCKDKHIMSINIIYYKYYTDIHIITLP